MFIQKIYIFMTAYHTNRCFSFPNAAKHCIKADYKAVLLSISTKFYFTTSSPYSSSSEVNCKKLGVAVPIWPQLCYYYCNHMELNSWLRSLHERCPKHWIDSSRKFQDHLQTQGNKKKTLNDDYNKNTFIIATTKIIMNKNIFLYTYSNIVHESPSPSISEVQTTATSSIISLFQSDSESDQSIDSLPPSPKQPRIEQDPKVSVVYINVAYLAQRRSSLTEQEKYNFY